MNIEIEQTETLAGCLRTAFVTYGPTSSEFIRAETACIVAGWSQSEINQLLDKATRGLAVRRTLSRLYNASRDYGPSEVLDNVLACARALGISPLVIDQEVEAGHRAAHPSPESRQSVGELSLVGS
jgi:hypothetical protein